jgi:glycosidase
MAEMVPAAFWHWATDKVKYARKDNVKFIGEVYDPAQYRNYINAGFDYLYDKVGMYDCLRDVVCHRRPAADITRQWQVNNDILSHMLYFLENHDEQRIASDFFAADPRKGLPAMVVCAWLNTSPVMIYAGQEMGERGMDQEGFSGSDGRTTIFDYWAPDTLRRWGDRRRMKREEKELFDVYTKILTLANQEDAFSKGEFFDLMYVNPAMERQFAFIRKYGRQMVLVVANFDEKDAECDVVVPGHAFDYWQMKEGMLKAEDLLSGEKSLLMFAKDKPLDINVPALSARAWKMIIED